MRPYLLGSSFPGCNYVRVHMPAWINGFQTNKKSMRASNDSVELVRQEIQGADVVVFHRPETEDSLKLAELCRKDGKKVVMDNDDTFYIDENHPLHGIMDGESKNLVKKIEIINEFIKKADLVTCSTEMLKKEYQRLNDNVVVIPNCVNPDDWDKPLRNTGKKVRIGIVGSAAFEYDYLHVKDLITKLSNRKDVEIVMFGLGTRKHRDNNPLVTKTFKDEYDFWDTINFDHFPWCNIEDYPATLNEARLDIMLIPRKENYFNTCKSNLKFLEAAMCEIPVIAQSFKDGPYEELHGPFSVNGRDIGILIKDNADWEKEIELLIKDKKLRRSIGKKAKQYVLSNYDINKKDWMWEWAYKSLFK